jgi:hypothetical protein
LSVQASPFPFTHVPEPLQICEPAHSLSGSRPFVMFPHSPSEPKPFFAALHAAQRPVQLVLQHTPSTQFPLEHSEVRAQVAPFGFTHVPEPLQNAAPEHSFAGS